jgi:hypothetical protein
MMIPAVAESFFAPLGRERIGTSRFRRLPSAASGAVDRDGKFICCRCALSLVSVRDNRL